MKPLVFLLSIFLSSLAGAVNESAPDLHKRIQKITFPSVNFRNSTLAEALADLTTRSKELDGDPDESKRGVTFLVIPDTGRVGDAGGDETSTEKIGYSGRNVSLETVLQAIGSSTRRDVYVTSSGIVICPAGTDPFPNKEEFKGDIFRKL